MGLDVWLPKGYNLPDGSQVCDLFDSGENWQIFYTNASTKVLVARSSLVQAWGTLGLLSTTHFSPVLFAYETFHCLSSHMDYTLASIEKRMEQGDCTEKADALAFALALKDSRALLGDDSLHDAIYVERFSRLLPVWTSTPHVSDDIILGTWLTGGVGLSIHSFKRLNSLVYWMSAKDLSEVITTAGFKLATPGMPVGECSIVEQVVSYAHTGCVATETREPLDHTKVFTLPGRPYLESFFNDYVIDIIFNLERYQSMGIDFPSAIVLHGPPGCGKTFAVDRLVEFIGWPCYSITSGSIGSPYIHDTSKKISDLFDKAIDNAPSIVVIDEMEAFLSERQSPQSSGQHHIEEVAEFLRRIPEAIANKVLIIAMTNLIDTIDAAILRRGRFDHIIEVEMPSRDEVRALLHSLLTDLPTVQDLCLDEAIEALAGKAMSDVAFTIREASRYAVKAGQTALDQESLDAALRYLSSGEKNKNQGIGFIRNRS